MSTPERWLSHYRSLLLIRLTEERIASLYAQGGISGTCHLCIGQEAAAVGVAEAMKKGDLAVSCHRGHGHLLAMGGDPERLLGELMGKRNGYCRGRGGSQHISVPQIGFLGTNGITGGGIPLATGAALSQQMRGTGAVVVCFFGDGASNQGTFHESLNMAALWRLPVVYVCENNGYAMSEPVERTIAGGDILARPRAYGIASWRADGMDVEATSAAAHTAVEHARAGRGPAFLELLTYRFCGHSKSDRMVYRTREEEAQWKQRDPILTTRERLDSAGLSTEADRVRNEVEAQLALAERNCRACENAEPHGEVTGVYADA